MLVNKAYLLEKRKGEELKAPRYASAAATRDGNLSLRDGKLPHSRHWQLFFCGCPLYINTA